MLHAARELLAVRSPLDAEVMVSEMLGTWWGERLGSDDLEEILGEGLVDHAARAGTPAALALLLGIACLGTPGQAVKAERAAIKLIDAGVKSPAWADRVGMASPSECYVSRDVYGDQDVIMCVFTYDGAYTHAVIATIDYNRGGLVTDAWASSKIEKLLDCHRQEARNNPLMRFEQMEPGRTRALVETALRVTDGATKAAVSESFRTYHALLEARVRGLPPGGRSVSQPTYSADRRATMAAEFLASDEAEELSDRSSASKCVDHIIDYGCDHDFGRPLRVSPTKCETFLLHWLPRKVLLSPDAQEAMPHVMAAWVRWASHRNELPSEGVGATLDKLWDITGTFAKAYRDPTTYGLERELVQRLLPDGDLEALPRRAFAFPFLTGRHGDLNLGGTDPSAHDDRRRLLEFEHRLPGIPLPVYPPGDDTPSPELARHIGAHLELAARLWDGDPPVLWVAAQRLLDRGVDRHEIMHLLIEAVARCAGSMERLPAVLHMLDENL